MLMGPFWYNYLMLTIQLGWWLFLLQAMVQPRPMSFIPISTSILYNDFCRSVGTMRGDAYANADHERTYLYLDKRFCWRYPDRRRTDSRVERARRLCSGAVRYCHRRAG